MEVKEYADENRRRTADELVDYLVVEPGDLVLNTMWLNFCGLGVSSVEGVVSPAYRVYRLDRTRLELRFAHHLFRSQPYVDEFTRLAYGIRPNSLQVSADDLGSLPVPLPPMPEQRRIADFLDRKTAALDALIEHRGRQLEALAEHELSIITRSVTAGLGANETRERAFWAPAMPSHWQLLALRRLVTEFVDYRGRTPTKVDDGVPLITAGAIRDGVIDHARAPEFMLADEYETFMRRGKPDVDDLVFTTEAPLGEVALVKDTTHAFAQRVILFRIDRRRMRPEFLWLFYRSSAGRAEVASRASGSTAEGIRADRLRASLVPVPPLPEQDTIISHVREQTMHLSHLRKLIGAEIDRLREHRQSLITAAVTGQLAIP